MPLKGHRGIAISNFNGYWNRGDVDSTPSDHFADCNNIKYIANSAFGPRDGVGISQNVSVPLSNVKRIYNYPTKTDYDFAGQYGNTLIVLTYNEDADEGSIHHVINSTLVYGPLLTISGMRDFAFVPFDTRAYISPIGYYTATSLEGTLNIELGLKDEFLYVYMGDGTAARKAAGDAPTGTLTIANGAAGHTDAGFKLFGVVYETDSGFLSSIGAINSFTTSATNSVSFANIPTSGSPTVVKRHLVATKTIHNYNGDTLGYTYYFIPGGVLNDNITTVLNNLSFFDQDLLADASHLEDLYTEIPAGAVLTTYHNRLVLGCTYTDISLLLVSTAGEPEAINQIDGLCIFPLDGNPLTNAQEMRDILYTFKRDRTGAFIDNGDVPSSWPFSYIDQALGSSLHGVATVLDSGGTNIDMLLIANYKGINQFNGTFINPELSWKIQNFWNGLSRNEFRKIQMVNDPIGQQLLLVLPDNTMLYGNYLNGMNAKNIRWSPWTFNMSINSVAIAGVGEIVFGADLP